MEMEITIQEAKKCWKTCSIQVVQHAIRRLKFIDFSYNSFFFVSQKFNEKKRKQKTNIKCRATPHFCAKYRKKRTELNFGFYLGGISIAPFFLSA